MNLFFRNLMIVLAALLAVMVLSPKDSPIWTATEAIGMGGRCPAIRDSNGDGQFEVSVFGMPFMRDDCLPGHPDYTDPAQEAFES